jgi:aspartate/methionine/tyrosine aminotransferase
VQPREFFIEDRLEKYRTNSFCNLGESGLSNYTLGEILDQLSISPSELSKIPLDDSPNQGSEELRNEIAKLYGQEVSSSNVLVTTGTSEALYIYFHLLLKKNDQVSLLWPAFQALYEIPMMLGTKIRRVETGFKDLFDSSNRLAIINHPHNPSGTNLLASDWELIESFCKNNNSLEFLFDEHYRFLDFATDMTRSGALLRANCSATGSITKCFGVVGLKIGWLIAREDLIQKARSFKDYLTHTVNPISEFLACKILQNRQTIIAPIKERIQDNIHYFQSKLSSLKSIEHFLAPDSGLVSFPKLKGGILSEEYADRLYDNTGVFVLPGINFETEGYIRIGFGEVTERFREGINRWVAWESK